MYRQPWETKQCWSYLQADVPSYFFSWNALFQACSRLRGFSDAEANANGKGSSPDSDLSSLSCYLFQAPLILLVWGRPRIPQMSRILRGSKEGWKEGATCWLRPWHSRAPLRGGVVTSTWSLQGHFPDGPSRLAHTPPRLREPHSPRTAASGLLLWALCRQPLAFNPVEAGVWGTKDRTGAARQWPERGGDHSRLRWSAWMSAQPAKSLREGV